LRFFVGLHQVSDAKHFDAAFISVNRLRNRKSHFQVKDWIMDSGAFTEVVRHGGYRFPVSEYASHIKRFASCGTLLAAVAQDYMCESFVLEQTGKTIKEHQDMTIERYDDLMSEDVGGVYIMPVLQGYDPQDYVNHVKAYGKRLKHGAWVGVGSVCKRNSNPKSIEAVLLAIHRTRPDLRLHGFGVKTTGLGSSIVSSLLETADSMAWSYGARVQGRSGNDWREAEVFRSRIESRQVQKNLFI
jgi:transcriptional regulator of met regulon